MKTSFPLNSRKVGPDNKERVAGARDLRMAGVSRDFTVQYPKSEIGNKVAKETRDQRQFRLFLDAAATLGSHLTATFDDVFLKVVPVVRGEVFSWRRNSTRRVPATMGERYPDRECQILA